MPSIREVAKHAGVSISTVSRVINGNSSVAPPLRNKVLAAIDRCDYLPAVGRKATDAVALVYAGPFTPGSPYDSATIDGMVEVMRDSPYDLTIVDMRRDKLEHESYRQFFARKGMIGAIVRSTAVDRPLINRMAEELTPIVVLGDHFDHPRLSFVYASSFDASVEAVEHLISLEHRRIAFAACERDDGDHNDRFQAYCQVMQRANLWDPSLVFRIPPHRADGAQLLRRLMAMPFPPSGLFVADPYIAVGVVNEAHHLGIKFPQDLSLVGFDDTDTRSSVYPRMTAVCQDSRVLGRVAFETLLKTIAGGAPIERTDSRCKAWLEINATTGPAPGQVTRVLTHGVRLPAATA